MGIGPAPATKKLCARLGLKPCDFDVIELNEAFASQGIAVLRELGIAEDAEHVNPNGGAIALGHPLGHVRRAHRRHGGAGAAASAAARRRSRRCASASARESRWRWSGREAGQAWDLGQAGGTGVRRSRAVCRTEQLH